MNKNHRICVVPKIDAGGPATFQRNLIEGLKSRGIDVTCDLEDEPFNTILVINGTRHLRKLWRCKRNGKRITQRLGMPNHLRYPILLHAPLNFRATTRNVLMHLIRDKLASHVVYQSRFASEQWGKYAGKTAAGSTIVNNGVNLKQFCPEGPKYQSSAQICILCVEGTQGSDPFDTVINLGQQLCEKNFDFEILMFGALWNNAQTRFSQYPFIKFMGDIPRSQLPFYYRGADIFLSTDILTAGCPNSVLEALGCGLPVLGYKAGVLPEIVDESSSRCIPCEGDPFTRGQRPGNLAGLGRMAMELLANKDHFRHGARRLAETRYDLEPMADRYVRILFGSDT